MKLLRVAYVEVFETLFGGHGPCPACGSNNVALLATTNEWKNRCGECRVRFNDANEVLREEAG